MDLCRCVISKIKYAGRDSDKGASIGVISQKRKKKFDVPRRDPLGTPGPPGEDPACRTQHSWYFELKSYRSRTDMTVQKMYWDLTKILQGFKVSEGFLGSPRKA